jgi:phenylalanine-4-hydroxylase
MYWPKQHQTWKTLCAAQAELIPGRAISHYLKARASCGIDENRIPAITELDAIVHDHTGWRLVRVDGYVKPAQFFSMLAAKTFPCMDGIRNARELYYTSEPDMFHDVFGHVVTLADPTYSEYYNVFGRVGERAVTPEHINALHKIYWFSMEFGLVNPTALDGKERDPSKTCAYGAALMAGLNELTNSIGSGFEKRPFTIDAVLASETDVHKVNSTLFEVTSLDAMLSLFCDWARQEGLL